MNTKLAAIDELVADEKYDQAEAACRELSKLYPNDFHVFSKLSYVKAASKDYTSAIEALRAATLLAPEQPSLWWKMGRYLLMNDSAEEAICAFSKAIELSKRHSDEYYLEVAYFLRAEANCRLKNWPSVRVDLTNVRDDMSFWLEKQLSKAAILARCP